MTSQNVLQIALVTGAACLFIGYIGCSFFDLYREGGTRYLKSELRAEVELNVKLLEENNRLDEYSNYVAGLLTDHRDKCPIFHPELTAPTFDGAEGRGGDVSGHARPHVSPDEDARAFFIERLGEGCRFLRHTDGRLCEGCRKAEAIIEAIVL